MCFVHFFKTGNFCHFLASVLMVLETKIDKLSYFTMQTGYLHVSIFFKNLKFNKSV